MAIKYITKEEVLNLDDRSFQDSVKDFSEELYDDKDVMMKAVSINGHLLKFASTRLQGDEDIVLAALECVYFTRGEVDQTAFLFDYIDEKLLMKKDFALKCIKLDKFLIFMIPEEIEGFEDILLEAVNKSGILLKDYPEYAGDKKIAIAAVKNDRRALDYVAPGLKEEIENQEKLVNLRAKVETKEGKSENLNKEIEEKKAEIYKVEKTVKGLAGDKDKRTGPDGH